MRRLVARGQAVGRRRRSEGGLIAMQFAGKRARIIALDLMLWRQSNELCSLCLNDCEVPLLCSFSFSRDHFTCMATNTE